MGELHNSIRRHVSELEQRRIKLRNYDNARTSGDHICCSFEGVELKAFNVEFDEVYGGNSMLAADVVNRPKGDGNLLPCAFVQKRTVAVTLPLYERAIAAGGVKGREYGRYAFSDVRREGGIIVRMGFDTKHPTITTGFFDGSREIPNVGTAIYRDDTWYRQAAHNLKRVRLQEIGRKLVSPIPPARVVVDQPRKFEALRCSEPRYHLGKIPQGL